MGRADVEHCGNCGSIREHLSDRFCRQCGASWIATGPAEPDQTRSLSPVVNFIGTDEAKRPTRRLWSAWRPPGGIWPALFVVVLLAVFMTSDRLWLHVYAPDTSSLKRQIRASQDTESRDYLDLQNRVSSVDKNVQNALNTQPTVTPADSGQFLRDMRIANALTVLSLVSNYGTTGSTASAAGKACQSYLLFGTGSFTDCGFQHVDQ